MEVLLLRPNAVQDANGRDLIQPSDAGESFDAAVDARPGLLILHEVGRVQEIVAFRATGRGWSVVAKIHDVLAGVRIATGEYLVVKQTAPGAGFTVDRLEISGAGVRRQATLRHLQAGTSLLGSLPDQLIAYNKRGELVRYDGTGAGRPIGIPGAAFVGIVLGRALLAVPSCAGNCFRLEALATGGAIHPFAKLTLAAAPTAGFQGGAACIVAVATVAGSNQTSLLYWNGTAPPVLLRNSGGVTAPTACTHEDTYAYEAGRIVSVSVQGVGKSLVFVGAAPLTIIPTAS